METKKAEGVVGTAVVGIFLFSSWGLQRAALRCLLHAATLQHAAKPREQWPLNLSVEAGGGAQKAACRDDCFGSRSARGTQTVEGDGETARDGCSSKSSEQI